MISVLDCAVSARYLASLVGEIISGRAVFGILPVFCVGIFEKSERR